MWGRKRGGEREKKMNMDEENGRPSQMVQPGGQTTRRGGKHREPVSPKARRISETARLLTPEQLNPDSLHPIYIRRVRIKGLKKVCSGGSAMWRGRRRIGPQREFMEESVLVIVRKVSRRRGGLIP